MSDQLLTDFRAFVKEVTGREEPDDVLAEALVLGGTKPVKLKRAIVVKNLGPHSYSSTQLSIPSNLAAGGEVTAAMLTYVQRIFLSGDLAEKGVEDDLHVTVKYGLMTSDAEEVRQFVRSFGKVLVRLGRPAVFDTKDGDAVIIKVDGVTLRDLNNVIAQAIPHEDTYPNYVPHITLAYVQSGLGQKYVDALTRDGTADVLEGSEMEFSTLTFSDQEGNRTIISLIDPDASAIRFLQAPASQSSPDSLPDIIDLPDIRQQDHYSCGAAVAMSVGRHFGVGPETLEQWKAALGTTEQNSTSPTEIMDYLIRLGLRIEARHHMTVEGLQRAFLAGRPVICPVQEYGVPSKQASFKYGHYVAVIGVGMGLVIVQDPSIDNALKRPGGTVHPGSEDPDVLQAPGRSPIVLATWLKAWHDEDSEGNKYVRFGIVVSPPQTAAKQLTKAERTAYVVWVNAYLTDRRQVHGYVSLNDATEPTTMNLNHARLFSTRAEANQHIGMWEQGRGRFGDKVSTMSGSTVEEVIDHGWAAEGDRITLKSLRRLKGKCEQGETQASTGCTPRGGEGAAGDDGADDSSSGKPGAGKPGKPSGKGKKTKGAPDHPGAAYKSKVKVTPSTQRAISANLKPVAGVKIQPTPQETGRISEAVIEAWMKTQPGMGDIRAMNSNRPNAPIDQVADHMSIEVKGGLASNSKKAQQWRITFSLELSDEAQAEYDALPTSEKKAFREEMQQACWDRKMEGLLEAEKEIGHEVKPMTATTIINPDTQTADIYLTDGFHPRLGWSKGKYVASVKYDHAD